MIGNPGRERDEYTGAWSRFCHRDAQGTLVAWLAQPTEVP